MIELLKQLISINIDLDGFTFYGKWLIVLPLIVANFILCTKGVKSIFSGKRIIKESR